MTWEETIQYIQDKKEYLALIKDAYLDQNLIKNITHFHQSDEFKETLNLLTGFLTDIKNKKLLDVGAGNGIASLSFAQKGFQVTAVEPDNSELIGSNAIRKTAKKLNLKNLQIIEAYGEDLPFESRLFDVVYARQAMHHALDLKKFAKELNRVLKPGGIFLAVRDHVIYSEKDKQRFLNSHPLQKFYGGENAFTLNEYKKAYVQAGFKVKRIFPFYGSVINYAPLTKTELNAMKQKNIDEWKAYFSNRFSLISSLPLLQNMFVLYKKIRFGILDEKDVPGRLYTFVLQKK